MRLSHVIIPSANALNIPIINNANKIVAHMIKTIFTFGLSFGILFLLYNPSVSFDINIKIDHRSVVCFDP